MSENVQCIECVHLSRKDTPREFRDLRFLKCKKGGVGEFVSPTYPRTCKNFSKAPSDDVAARRRWLDRRSSDAQSEGNTAAPQDNAAH